MDIMVFVDESGSIPHEADSNNYFVIAMLFTDSPNFLRKVFKRERLKSLTKNLN
jgi:7,8-dihydro-6-hydroxymethylpterin-pyrophosphokinase